LLCHGIFEYGAQNVSCGIGKLLRPFYEMFRRILPLYLFFKRPLDSMHVFEISGTKRHANCQLVNF
jgi:hypothetical protein